MGSVNMKVVVIGPEGVGKTAIIKRLIDNSFSDAVPSTVGVEFETTALSIDNRTIKLQIWDTAGQERFRSIAKAYYRNAAGVLLVFDLTERKSFDDLSSWVLDIRALCPPNAVVQLIGNKADQKFHRSVPIHEAENFASRHRLSYIETSAKIGENVKEAFVRVAASVLNSGIRVAVAIARSPRRFESEEKNGCC
jgi:small GTP-binding protein